MVAKTGKKTGKTVKSSKAAAKVKSQLKFTIKCSAPVADDIFDIASFEKFLSDKIKVDGKAGQLGSAVTLQRAGSDIKVTAKAPFSKRYLKYLTKKFLKKQQLRDYIRVISDEKTSYLLKYFNVTNEEEES
eukprot:TRINITY_DN3253_c0_g1_i2.p1 TRINITY_DN3253_c0_g1~~TRINITY_DN3253_c0_g1_i2.p1  ORF type:complete len:131 (-),score=55.02 TRINITY_DN3253_c0_g1_i2:39-431(-)